MTELLNQVSTTLDNFIESLRKLLLFTKNKVAKRMSKVKDDRLGEDMDHQIDVIFQVCNATPQIVAFKLGPRLIKYKNEIINSNIENFLFRDHENEIKEELIVEIKDNFLKKYKDNISDEQLAAKLNEKQDKQNLARNILSYVQELWKHNLDNDEKNKIEEWLRELLVNFAKYEYYYSLYSKSTAKK
jgi:hypothetical protein